jgi:hypothetical protein
VPVAIVRCPVHNIPYNDANPRGCPACVRERSGDDTADVIRELARASRVARGIERPGSAPTVPAVELLTPPAPAEPQAPGLPERALLLVKARRLRTLGLAAIAVLAVVVALVTGPRYVDAPHPPPATGETRPLPIEPNGTMATTFAVLGAPPPEPVPDEPRLARYRYGTDLVIDAYNEQVHRITFRLSNRSWRGITVGAPEQTIRGALALLGSAREETRQPPMPPQTVSGYQVYPSLDERPQRTLRVAVQPPNGCYDVAVDLRPRVTGLLLKGSNRYAVIGEGDASPQWVSTEVRITSRAAIGPDGTVVGCR